MKIERIITNILFKGSVKLMITKLFTTVVLVFISGCTNFNQKQAGNSISEKTEWARTWMVNTCDKSLPRILIIGDSHVERYYGVVAGNLKSKANCCKYTTSRSLGDPYFIDQLKLIFKQYDFDIISFNNGLHGADYSIDEYSEFVPIAYELLKKNAKKTVIWVNSTAIRVRDNIKKFAPRNQQIIERNKFLADFTKQNNIILIDFYSKTANNIEYYSNDGVHFNNSGVNIEAELVTQKILEILKLTE